MEAALAPLVAEGATVVEILDAGFDDVAVWAEVWGQRHRLVCRLCHRDRLVRPTPDAAPCHLADLAPRLRDLARLEAEMVVQKAGQARPKLQPVTATVAATPVVVAWRPGQRTRAEGDEQDRACWLVEVRLAKVGGEPWWLLTDRPVETAEQAAEVFRKYCQRWSIEDAFKTAKTCLGWEDVQVLAYDAVRLLVALGWVATGFLFELGVTLEWGELRRLFDLLATEAILADEERRHGGLPPRIAAMLGRPPPPELRPHVSLPP